MSRISVRSLLTLGLCLVGVLATACTQPPVVVPAEKHAAISPDQVKIYAKPPAKYEDLGTITLVITPDLGWDAMGDADKGFDALKAKAAALGANGLLLAIPRSEFDLVASTGYHRERYDVPMRMKPEKTAVAHAIYMLKEYKE